MLPNLVVIGAKKAATTSLHHYLGLHPEIGMSTPKELDFFVEQRNWVKGVAWYESHFSVPASILGETSPSYTMHPRHPGVPQRLAALIPDVKLVYVVRDPVERIVSDYLHRRARRREKRTLAEAVSDPETSRYVATSRYAMQLERYLDYFPAARMLVLDQVDLAQRPEQTLQRVFRFLDVDDGFTTPAFTFVYNRTERGRPRSVR